MTNNNDGWEEFRSELMAEIAEGQGLTVDEYKGEIDQAREYAKKLGSDPENGDELLHAYCKMRDVERSFFEDECKEAAKRVASRGISAAADEERKVIGEHVSREYSEGRMSRDEFKQSQYAVERGLD